MVVMVLTMLVFLPSVSGAFVYDDIPLIAENEYVHSWQHVGRAFRTHFWDITLYEDAAEMRGSAGQRQYYRPIVTVTYLANWVLGGGKAWAFHLVNTLLHALAAWLAVRAATRWTYSSSVTARLSRSLADRRSSFSARESCALSRLSSATARSSSA